jgi:hypothetical protein
MYAIEIVIRDFPASRGGADLLNIERMWLLPNGIDPERSGERRGGSAVGSNQTFSIEYSLKRCFYGHLPVEIEIGMEGRAGFRLE